MDKALNLAARLLMAQIFIISGFGKITGYAGTLGYFGQMGLPMPGIVLPLVILIELGGGLALLFGIQTRWVAAILALFTVGSALIAHSDFSQQMQQIQFMKNLAITGGLLLFVRHGAGLPSVDREA